VEEPEDSLVALLEVPVRLLAETASALVLVLVVTATEGGLRVERVCVDRQLRLL
jgi:hypothetical protein